MLAFTGGLRGAGVQEEGREIVLTRMGKEREEGIDEGRNY